LILYEVLLAIDRAFTGRWQLQLHRPASSQMTLLVDEKTMLAWMSRSAEKSGFGKQAEPVAAGLLYRLTLAFPSWAGAILAVYTIFLCRFSALKIRLR
jgi:hypothetical protein